MALIQPLLVDRAAAVVTKITLLPEGQEHQAKETMVVMVMTPVLTPLVEGAVGPLRQVQMVNQEVHPRAVVQVETALLG